MSTQAETLLMDTFAPDSYWREVFKKYDYDKDGKISYVDFKAIIKSKDYGKELPDHVAEAIIALAVAENSGHLTDAAFIKLVHTPRATVARRRGWLDVLDLYLQKYVDAIVPPRSLDDDEEDPTGNGAVTHKRTPVPLADRFGDDAPTDEPGDDGERVFRDADVDPGAPPAGRRRCCWPPAILMLLMSALDFIVFWCNASSENVAVGPLSKIFMYDSQKRHEAWRFIAYMLVHLDPFHLFKNMVIQIFLGLPLEIRHRWWRVLLVYAAGGLAASLANSLADPLTPLAGSSGAVYALSTAHIATLIMCWSTMWTGALQMLGFIVLVAFDIYAAVHCSDCDQTIAYIHYAGAAAGLLVGIGVFHDFKKGTRKNFLWRVAVGLFCVLTLIAVLANIFWTQHFTKSDGLTANQTFH